MSAANFHISAVERAGLSGFAESQKAPFEPKIDQARGKVNAENLSLAQTMKDGMYWIGRGPLNRSIGRVL